MNISKFKEQCLGVIDTLSEEGIVITKRGKPVAKVIPIQSGSAHLIGSMKGGIQINGDIFSTGVKWKADRGRKGDKP